MNRKKFLALLLAGGMLAQTAMSVAMPLEAQAAEETWVSVDQLTTQNTADPAKDSVVPSKNQYEYQKQELAAFCHFGMNTYTGSEWGNGQENPNQFQLTKPFDATTYVKAIKEAGFKKIIVTAKHHDGFCIWPSAYTEHDTETSGYKGDVLAELSKACTDENIDMGLYLSPWDVNHKSYGYFDEKGNSLVDRNGNPLNGMTWDEVEEKDVDDYNEYYDNQLKEILGNDKYGNAGRFKEVWMDGAKGEGSKTQNYDFQRWFDTIQKEEGTKAKKFDDDCLQFGSGAYTTVHWIGNESGFANEETWAKANASVDNNTFDSNMSNHYAVGHPDGNKWSVPEADTKITAGWFWGPKKKTPHTMEQLAEIYFRSVGHNSVLLLNIPPNQDGTVDTDILARVKEFGNAVKGTFDDNLAKNADIKASAVKANDNKFSPAKVLDGDDNTYWTVEEGTKEGKLLIDLKETKTFDVVSIEEAIQFGQRIGSYKVEYKNGNGEWKVFDQGTTIGSKRLCRKTPVKADKLKITVTAHDKAENKAPILSEVGVYQATGGFELGNGIPADLTVIDNKAFERSAGWKDETPEQSLEGTSMWCKGNPSNAPWAEATFTGTKVWLIGTIDPGHGPADVYIDDVKVASIDTNSKNRRMMHRIFESDTLENKEHKIKIVNTGTTEQALGLDAAVVLNNGGKGMVEIEKESYRMNEDSELPITLKRVGGTEGELKVKFEVSPGSAWQKHFDADGHKEVTFAPGQETAQVSVKSKRVLDKDGDLYFTAALSKASDDTIIGFNARTKITITDTESYNKKDLEKKVADLTEQYKDKENLYTTASYEALQNALKEARKVLKVTHPEKSDLAKAGSALDVAIASLVQRQAFSAEDAFVLPRIKGTKKAVEAEYFILKQAQATDKNVKIVTDKEASNGKKVGWIMNGDQIILPFVAEKAGTYTFKTTYQSGRNASNPNVLQWTGTNVTAGEVNVTGSDSNGKKFETIDLTIEIPAAGAGELIFTTNEKEAPNLDKFETTATDVSSENFEIEVTAGENGAITYDLGNGAQTIAGGTTEKVSVVEGATPSFTFVPNAIATGAEIDYAVAEVTADGIPVGPQGSYTFESIAEAGHSLQVTFEKAIYDENSRFEFPIDGRGKTLEAERFQLNNTGDENETWKLEVKSGEGAEWASGNKFVNSMNAGDQIILYYNAAQAGEYLVTLDYRSGSQTNALNWKEDSDLISEGNASAGATDGAAATHQASFKLNVVTPGAGRLVFTAPEGNAPQLDKFEIESTKPEVLPANTTGLKGAISEAEVINGQLDNYVDGEAKDNFVAQLNAAKALLARIENDGELVPQEEVDQMTATLKATMEGLTEKDQTPQVDKTKLAEAIEKAQALDLSKFQEEGKAEFAEALKQAESVMADENATDETVTAAVYGLNAAMANLKPLDPDTGDGDGSGNGDIGNGGSGNDGSGNNSSNNTQDKKPGAIATGDTQNPLIYVITMGAAVVVVLAVKKKFTK